VSWRGPCRASLVPLPGWLALLFLGRDCKKRCDGGIWFWYYLAKAFFSCGEC
jgi:hypothetical protein